MSSVVLAFAGFFPVRHGCGRRKYVFVVEEMMWYTLSIIALAILLYAEKYTILLKYFQNRAL
jgi:hypothetical protein